MDILLYLVAILPFICSTLANSPAECNSKTTHNEYCDTLDEGFTKQWHTYHIPLWKKHLNQFAHKTDLNYLEIGSYEGKSAIWLLENILTHPTSRLTCIDPWIDVINFSGENIFTRFSKNIQKYVDKINIVRNYSSNVLRKYDTVPIFDLIYVDGCHTALCALEDMVLSFPLLKPGGLMIIDDYKWNTHFPQHERPQLAVDTFIKIFTENINVLYKGWQVIIEKKDDSIISSDEKSINIQPKPDAKKMLNNEENGPKKVKSKSKNAKRKRNGEHRKRGNERS